MKVNSFGSSLKGKRLERGLTLKELGKSANLSYVAISYIENGKKTPRPNTVFKLANALGCEPLIDYDLKSGTSQIIGLVNKEENKYAN